MAKATAIPRIRQKALFPVIFCFSFLCSGFFSFRFKKSPRTVLLSLYGYPTEFML